MIDDILPEGTACAESFGDIQPARLYPQEAAHIARAVPRRRDEFATGRECARRALAALGEPACEIPPGVRGAPCWPEGILGTITHCAGYRAAVVARASDLAYLGVDAEPHAPLPDGVLRRVSLPAEREQLAELAGARPDTHWDRILFCTKESVYKAWYPPTRRWLGFDQAQISIDLDGRFEARLLVPAIGVDGQPLAGLTGFAGRWLVRDGLVATAIAVPRSAPA